MTRSTRAVLEAKSARGFRCDDCRAVCAPRALHWHHRKQESKIFNVGSSAQRALAAVLDEIEKCDLLCSPCHGARHVAMRKANGTWREGTRRNAEREGRAVSKEFRL